MVLPKPIKVGATAWSDRSLVESGWYPRDARTPEARLRYYATKFDITENDSAYYAVPDPHHGELWVARTPEGFTMNVKAFATVAREVHVLMNNCHGDYAVTNAREMMDLLGRAASAEARSARATLVRAP